MRVAGGWGRMVMVGRKGGGTSPPENDTRDGMLTSFDVSSKEVVGGPDFCLKMSHTYQVPEV